MSALVDVTQDEPRRQLAAVVTPMDLLSMVVQQGADPEKLGQLMLLQERWEANEARKAYSIAFAAFKAEGIKVVRNITIKDGPLKGKKHADLFSIVDAATEALSKHGLSASYRIVEDSRDWIRVACVIKHVAGHSEETTFGGPIDTGPGRNAIQARKSSVTYLERITLLLALGLAEQDADDDGAGGDSDSTALMKQLIAEAESTGTDEAALSFWKAHSPKLAAWPYAYEKFKQAVAAHRRTLKGGAQ